MAKNHKYLLLGVVGLAVLGVTGWYGWTHRFGLPGPSVPQGAVPEVRIILVKINTGCGHVMEESARLPETRLGSIGRLYKGWNIGGKKGDVLILTKAVGGLCPICQREQFLGVFQNKVAVFYGRPDRKGPVKEVTGLGIDHLPDQEKADLYRGIVFHDSREKLQLLEGLSSLQDE